MMIIDPLKRFSKNELNKQGYKLAFLDTSVMKLDKMTEKLLGQFHSGGIRPVVNHLSLAELIKGLNPTFSDYKKNIDGKKSIMRFLDDVKALSLLSHEYILAYEWSHIYANVNVDAYEEFKIFSNCPLGEVSRCNSTIKYECDKLLNCNYSPFEAKCTYEGYLQVSLRNIDNIRNIFKKGISDNYNSTVFSQDIVINHDVSLIKKDIDMQYIAYILEKISVFKSIEQAKLEQLINKFIDRTETFPLLSRAAPYYLIDDHIYHECLKKNDHQEKKKGNNFMDSMHARSALSYCDYFITEDDKLEKFCQKIIKDLKLKVKVVKGFKHFL